MPPNAWMWSLIQNCKSDEDIQLLFGILERLRKFVSPLALTLLLLFSLLRSHFQFFPFGFGCRGYRIFVFLIIIILTFAKRSPKHVYGRVQFNLVCHNILSVLGCATGIQFFLFAVCSLLWYDMMGLCLNLHVQERRPCGSIT